MANLTLIGMYNYDPTLFDNMTLPTGIESDLTIDAILERSGEFEVLYPDLEFMKLKIGTWFKRHYRTFDKWLAALSIDYNPLDNFDRHETYTDNRAGLESSHMSEDVTGNEKLNSSSLANSRSSGTTTPATTTITDSKDVSAYDSTGYQPAEKNTNDTTIKTSGTDSSTTNSGTKSLDDKDYSNNRSAHDNRISKDKIEHDAHLWGNIGVTTSQQMLQAELDVQRFNIYENIADLFIEDFCLMIY